VARSAVESKLLTGIKAELSTPEYLEEFKRGVRQALADVRSAHNSQRTARDKRLAELSGEIEHSGSDCGGSVPADAEIETRSCRSGACRYGFTPT
jgi:hypothetical protein